MTDELEELRREHYRHRMLARRLTGASPAERAERLAAVACHLRRHVEAGQPVLRAALLGGPDARDVASRTLRGQLLLCQHLAELGCVLHDPLRFDELARAYRAVMEHHLRVEEQELFPAAARAFAAATQPRRRPHMLAR